jgi:protein-tyrosine-phosphatase
VLFVCTGNTCRSVLAEHIARKKFGEYIEVASAGIDPGSIEDTHNAVFTLKSLFDLDASGHKPLNVRAVDIDTFDLVVAMSNQVAKQVQEIFPSLAFEHLVKWSIPDPYGDDLSQYQRCAAAINTQLKNLEVLKNRK